MQEGKNVTVLGIGKSGYESALFLEREGYSVFLSELKETPESLEKAELLRKEGIETEVGRHSFDRILASDWVLISPGVPPQAPVYKKIKEAGLPVVSEIEAASWFCPSKNIIAVTGSCGKTTVTTLITRVLQESGKTAFSCGNIGNPWISELQNMGKNDFVVLELSSFQLQHCKDFRPLVGLLLNITPNHQDWHKDMNEYAGAKLAIFQAQEESDYAFFRQSDQRDFFPEKTFKAQIVNFGESTRDNPNEEAVRKVAGVFGIHAGIIDKVFSQFSGLEHRMEAVLANHDVGYINDSKSTTTSSLAWALGKLPAKSVHLIAGGIAKSKDHGDLRSLLEEKVKALYLIGQAAPWLSEVWQGAAPAVVCTSLAEAVEKAAAGAAAGDFVLLSPACSSFDMFLNYEDRGSKFKELVKLTVRQNNLQKTL